jgi:hypothetical protein
VAEEVGARAFDGLFFRQEVVRHIRDFVLWWGTSNDGGEVFHDHSALECWQCRAELSDDVAVAAADFDEDDRRGCGALREIGEGEDRCETIFVPLPLDGKCCGHCLLEVGELLWSALHELEEAEVGVVGVLEIRLVGGDIPGVSVGDAGDVFGDFDDASELVCAPGGC